LYRAKREYVYFVKSSPHHAVVAAQRKFYRHELPWLTLRGAKYEYIQVGGN
jgi:hypothetical protein